MELHQFIDFFVLTANAATEAASTTSSGAEEGVLGALGVHWQLFLAQLFNFSVILFVLHRFAFKPISKKLRERSEKIDKALKDAEDIEREKEEFDIWKSQAMSAAKKEALTIVDAAKEEGSAEKARILEEARREMSKMKEQAQFQIASDEKRVLGDIKSQAAEMITAAAEKVLRKKLDNKKDQELISEILQNIK